MARVHGQVWRAEFGGFGRCGVTPGPSPLLCKGRMNFSGCVLVKMKMRVSRLVRSPERKGAEDKHGRLLSRRPHARLQEPHQGVGQCAGHCPESVSTMARLHGQISPGPCGADLPISIKNNPSEWPKRRTLSKGIVTESKSLHAATLIKTRDIAVRQSRLSPARDLEQPRPLGFTVTGHT